MRSLFISCELHSAEETISYRYGRLLSGLCKQQLILKTEVHDENLRGHLVSPIKQTGCNPTSDPTCETTWRTANDD